MKNRLVKSLIPIPKAVKRSLFLIQRMRLLWPALYGVLTPVCLEISEGLNILHSTSDILGITESDEGLQITLYGDRDLAGEIVFEGDECRQN